MARPVNFGQLCMRDKRRQFAALFDRSHLICPGQDQMTGLGQGGGGLSHPAALLDVWRTCIMPAALRRGDGGACGVLEGGAGPMVAAVEVA